MKSLPTTELIGSNELIASGGERPLGLGISVKNWFGDKLPFNTGEIPRGYITDSGFKQFNRSTHPPGHFSYGPYEDISGIGTLSYNFFMDLYNPGNPNDSVLTVDCYDANSRKLLTETTFKVKQFPTNSAGFILYTRNISLQSGQKLETRIFAHGGGDLRLYLLRWELYYA